MATCKSCGAEIDWAVTKNGKRIPLNAEWTPGGNIVIDGEGRAIVVGDDEPGFTGMVRRTSHFATCSNAAKHRRKT